MEWLVVALIIVAVVAVAAFVVMRQRSALLARRYGPEYERAVDEHGSRRAGEAELRRLEHRRKELDLRELDPEVRRGYVERWRAVQLGFVDEPDAAVVAADILIVEVMAARGYPVDDPDDRTGMVVADHPELAEDYRSAHAIRERSDAGAASVDELREGFQHFRALFRRLLGDAASEDEHTADARTDEVGADRTDRSDGAAPAGTDPDVGTPAGRPSDLAHRGHEEEDTDVR